MAAKLEKQPAAPETYGHLGSEEHFGTIAEARGNGTKGSMIFCTKYETDN